MCGASYIFDPVPVYFSCESPDRVSLCRTAKKERVYILPPRERGARALAPGPLGLRDRCMLRTAWTQVSGVFKFILKAIA